MGRQAASVAALESAQLLAPADGWLSNASAALGGPLRACRQALRPSSIAPEAHTSLFDALNAADAALPAAGALCLTFWFHTESPLCGSFAVPHRLLRGVVTLAHKSTGSQQSICICAHGLDYALCQLWGRCPKLHYFNQEARLWDRSGTITFALKKAINIALIT